MASLTRTIARVNRSPSGAISIVDTNGNGKEFGSVADMIDYASTPFDDESMWKVVAAFFLARSDDASDDNVIEAKSFVFDVAQNSAVLEVS